LRAILEMLQSEGLVVCDEDRWRLQRPHVALVVHKPVGLKLFQQRPGSPEAQ